VRNLGSVAIFTFIYAAKLVLYFVFVPVAYFTKWTKLSNYLGKMKHQVLFRDIFILLIDANTDFLIDVFLGEHSRSEAFRNFDYEGRVLSSIAIPSNDSFPKLDGPFVNNIFCKVSLFLLFVLLPTGYIYIYQQDLHSLKDSNFYKSWGYLYHHMSIRKSKTNIQFFYSFFIRRVVFVFLAFKCGVIFALMGLLFLNIIMTIHLG
jgi:hypothetical protein